MATNNTKISKFLSYVLRHNPSFIGMTLDKNGWAAVDELLECASRDGTKFSRDKLEEVVETNDKKRFVFSKNGLFIRANQGHSIDVDLELDAVEPPEKLYHGTAAKFLESILRNGLQPQNRHHVHLSIDIETATKVGRRHGKPIILEVDALRMAQEGHKFYCSANGVWLTDVVPPHYFSTIERQIGSRGSPVD